jgi:hypothetical protein
MDIALIQWISQNGTNDWLIGFIKNNAYAIGIFLILFGPIIKGKYPEFWENLKTIFPFVGQTKNTLIKQLINEEEHRPAVKTIVKKEKEKEITTQEKKQNGGTKNK